MHGPRDHPTFGGSDKHHSVAVPVTWSPVPKSSLKCHNNLSLQIIFTKDYQIGNILKTSLLKDNI